MQILRVGKPNLRYNVPLLNPETKFFLDGVEFHPDEKQYQEAYIGIAPKKNKFGEYEFVEGVLLVVDEEKLRDTESSRDANPDSSTDADAIKKNKAIRKKRLKLYEDFIGGKKTWAELLATPEEQGGFGVTDVELWLHNEAKTTVSTLETPKPKGTQTGLVFSRGGQ